MTVTVDGTNGVSAPVGYYLLDNAGGSILVGIPRGYIDGLIMSTAGSSATMSIAAGMATDSTGAVLMSLSSTMAKTTSAWSAGTGNGGLDTGTIANSTWYHFYIIKNWTTGVTDVLFSTSASAPTMPSGYTYKRRIGSGLTNGSAQWVLFSQVGDEFLWDVAVLDVNATDPGTSAVSRTLSVPTGVKVLALVNASATGSATNGPHMLLSDLGISDAAPSQSVAPLENVSIGGLVNGVLFVQCQIRTNTSSQIRSRNGSSGSGEKCRIVTTGWIDQRGRNA